MRRALACAAVAATLLSAAPPAGAHARTQLRVVSPTADATVEGGTVRLHVVGEGGDSPSTFQVRLDGQFVDATGTVGGIFSTLSVAPNDQLVLDVPVALGEHTLVVTPTEDVDAPQEAVTRRFTVVAKQRGGSGALVLAGIAVLVALGAVVAVRRQAARQQG